MQRGAVWLALTCALALPSVAQTAPLAKPKPRPELAQPVALPAQARPKPRPASALPPTVAPLQTAVGTRPKPRPNATVATAASPQMPPVANGLSRSPIPPKRPNALEQAVAQLRAAPQPAQGEAAATTIEEKPNLLKLLFGAGGAAKVPKGQGGTDIASAQPAPDTPESSAPRKGSVCGDRTIRGENIAPITSKVNGCGVADAVRVTEVAGIRLTQAVTVECGTVKALKTWIDSAMRPAFGNREVAKLRIAAHYACRGRNNVKGARISEHGKGRALDISGFIFTDGSEWSIARDYNKQVRKAHKAACGIFNTTLGPGSDGYHEDHLHFDTASYRAGAYCR